MSRFPKHPLERKAQHDLNPTTRALAQYEADRATAPRYPTDLDPMKLEPHFSRHMNSLTSEGLEGKGKIAEQLAWRDQQIEQLYADLAKERALHVEISRVYREEHERIAPLLAAAAPQSAPKGWLVEGLANAVRDSTPEQHQRVFDHPSGFLPTAKGAPKKPECPACDDYPSQGPRLEHDPSCEFYDETEAG